ncbi:ABC transporter permease [Lapidilactobacillus bayanensis]|uniref:ABC transporter permease n=1 Tax=Lapidilactobacillus bayanensis TaxID=2485998 RepID=UPI000F7A1EFA|nr:ABC transporter permease [Lapidilactobacillus bayanensis]
MRTIGIVKRVFKEMLRDKRTLVLMFIGPLFILSLVFFLFQNTSQTKTTLVVRQVDSELVTALKNDHLRVKSIHDQRAATTIIRQHDYAGLLTQKGDQLKLVLANSDQSKSTVIKQSIQQAQVKLKTQAAAATLKSEAATIKKLAAALAALTKSTTFAGHSGKATVASAKNYQLKTKYLYGSQDSTYFDTLLPILMGFIVFFFVFLISGIALLRERTAGTLYRLLATPIKRSEIIAGYLLGYGAFAIVQTLMVVIFTIYVFNIQIIGNIGLVILINLLMAAVALAIGLFISTFANSEFQMMQFIPIVAIPQIFFSGIIALDTMPNWLQVIAHLMPLYYGANSMTAVIEKGATFSTIAPNLGVLAVMTIIFLILNNQTLKRYRQV